jgi:hypothetical protein
MVMQVLVWIVVAVLAVIVGKWLGVKLFGAKKDVSNLRRSAQVLSIALRDAGLKRLPVILEQFVVGDVPDLLDSIHEMSIVVKSGNDAILKELADTFDRVLGMKLQSPEGRAAIKIRVLEAEKVALEVVKVAAPVVAAAAIAAL